MRQLVRNEPGVLVWEEVPEPELHGAAEALVSPIAVATCDLDGPIATGESPIPGPIAMGHECVAEVLEVGRDVESVRPGDRVVVPFQISCGSCRACRRGLTGSCERFDTRQMFGFGAFAGDWGGMLSDVVRVPHADAMLVPVPGELDPVAIASASDNMPDAWRCVAPQLAANPDGDVLVLGGRARSIGLYAAGIAVALGSGRVRYADDDPHRLAVAADLGADAVQIERGDQAISPTADVVVDAGASAESLSCACRSTSPGGWCTHVGIIYEPTTPVPLLEMYVSGITLHVGRAMARPAIEPLLSLVSSGRLRPELVTDRVLPFAAATEALLEPHTKLVFDRNAE
jgi:alcohol dehydrogenase